MPGAGPAVVPYDPDWPQRFEIERQILAELLVPWLEGGIHHIGSTAVPGLMAKPVIDLMAGVKNLAEARAAAEPLSRVGYCYHEHRPDAHAFNKPGFTGDWRAQTHHLHLTQPGGDLWRERLAFRDALRSDATLVAEYQEWKLGHLSPTTGPSAYTDTKRVLVARVLAGAGIELKPDTERLSASWLAARSGGEPR